MEGDEGLVDPAGGAFEFGIDADGGFVDDEVGQGGAVGADGMGPLGAVLLVGEGGEVAELLEDLCHGVAVGEGGFCLDAGFIAGAGEVGVGQALVGQGADVAVLAEAKELRAYAEIARGGVVEGVVLEGAWGFEMEARPGRRLVGLLDRRRGTSVRSRRFAWEKYTNLGRCKTGDSLRFCGFFEAVADRETEAVGGGQGAEDGGDVAVIEFAEAGEEGLARAEKSLNSLQGKTSAGAARVQPWGSMTPMGCRLDCSS